jgi:hypothetical protein
MRAPREQSLIRPALQLLGLRGCMAWRNNSGATSATHNGRKRFVRFGGTPGCSDIIGLMPNGRFLALELKSDTGRLTPAQRSFLERVEQLGGLALVVRSLKELERALDNLASDDYHRLHPIPTRSSNDDTHR